MGGVTPLHWRLPLWGAATASLITFVALWPTLSSLFAVWAGNQSYQFAWLIVPLLVFVLAWHDRQANLAVTPRPGIAGVLVTGVAALCWLAADVLNIDVARQFALVLVLQGIAMSALGWQAYWKLFPALGLLFLAVPSGDLFLPLLRSLTLNVIAMFATLAQYPLRVDGFIVWVGPHDYVVLNECAGLSHFLLATFLGYAFGLLLFRSLCKVVMLALFGAFIGILSNALRVCAIVLIDWINGSQMPLSAHTDIQWIALFLSLGLFFWTFSRLDADPAPTPAPAPFPGDASDRKAWQPVVAALIVALVAGGESWLLARQPVHPLAQPLTLPPTFSGWELTAPDEGWMLPHPAKARAVAGTYSRAGKTMTVRVVEATDIAGKLTGLEVAPSGKNAWHEYGSQPESACVGTRCTRFLHTIWADAVTGKQQHVYLVFALANQLTDSKLALRASQGWGRLTGSTSRPRVLGFAFDAPQDAAGVGELGVAARALQSTLDQDRI